MKKKIILSTDTNNEKPKVEKKEKEEEVPVINIDTKEAEVKAAIEATGEFEILEITRQKDWSSITARRV